MIDMSTCEVMIMHQNEQTLMKTNEILAFERWLQFDVKYGDFGVIYVHYDHFTNAHIDRVVPLECSTMFEMCSGCMEYLVTLGICRNRSPFKNFCARYALLVRSVPQHFLQTLSETQNPWFWALFETPQMSLIQLPAPVENFL